MRKRLFFPSSALAGRIASVMPVASAKKMPIFYASFSFIMIIREKSFLPARTYVRVLASTHYSIAHTEQGAEAHTKKHCDNFLPLVYGSRFVYLFPAELSNIAGREKCSEKK